MTKKELQNLIETTVEKTVEKTVSVLLKKRPELAGIPQQQDSSSGEEWVSTEEAARILRLSPVRLRAIKEHFTYKKNQGHQQGRLIFLRSSLLSNYYS